MQLWALLHFTFALAVTVSVFALIIGEMHMIERAERGELWRQAKKKIASIR